MHIGRTAYTREQPRWLMLEGEAEGSASEDLPVVGTNVHGLLQPASARDTLLRALVERRGFAYASNGAAVEDVYERLADVLEASLNHLWDFRQSAQARHL